jgi:hypothetical protein
MRVTASRTRIRLASSLHTAGDLPVRDRARTLLRMLAHIDPDWRC